MSEGITSFQGGMTFAGPDAVSLYRATALKVALSGYAKHGRIMNRMWTITNMLNAAAGITGKHYKRGQAQKAADDLKIWCDAMAAALPIKQEG